LVVYAYLKEEIVNTNTYGEAPSVKYLLSEKCNKLMAFVQHMDALFISSGVGNEARMSKGLKFVQQSESSIASIYNSLLQRPRKESTLERVI
jgi:hypothetical protein